MSKWIAFAAAVAFALGSTAMGQTPTAEPLSIVVRNEPKAISPDLFGVFFEDLNYAADGGLYAELIENRSFAYQPTEQPTWNALTGWELLQRGGGRGGWHVDDSIPLHSNNPTCLILHVNATGEGVGVSNDGYGGVAVKEGETYDVSLFARQIYMNERWGAGSAIEDKPMPIVVRIESKDGQVLGEASMEVVGREWKRHEAAIVANKTDAEARFVLISKARGGTAFDEISLFPRKTFRERKNGLRADLAEKIVDLKPRFVRFPGGCLAHGHSLGNMYRWKDTIGPIETRRGQKNLWGYHQTVGLGYFEYFQFCEDIGAKPLPVVAAGVSCQNSAHTSGVGQQCLPMDQMPAYIQEVLDLIEYANGPATSTWGAKRAAAGHPEPFGLVYLGVGNEDHITPEFEERFKMIYDAVREKHPEIVVIGTSGPFWRGEDYDKGWDFARRLKLPMVDEHYYVPPEWFWEHLSFYDTYDRNGSKVYLGEYAAHERDRKSTLRSALAEAAYMTSLERNGDIVTFASYAPLLAKQRHTQWNPDLIYFDNTTVSPTINYEVQKLFGQNAGDSYLPVTIAGEATTPATQPAGPMLAASCVRDSASGDLIVKIVTRAESAAPARLDLSAVLSGPAKAKRTVLSGDKLAVNAFGQPAVVSPVTTDLDLTPSTVLELPAHSLTVLRIAAGTR